MKSEKLKIKLVVLVVVLVYVSQIHAQQLHDGKTLFFDSLSDSYLCSVAQSCFRGERLSETNSDGKTVNFTFLPIVKITGDFGDEYSQGTVTVTMPDGTGNADMLAKIKWRGATTAGPDKHKKNYHVKFIDETGEKQDRKFFDFRKDNSWLLDAAQVDMSRIRNRVAMELWNDFATKPYYFSQEPKLRNYTRGQFVELFLDDEYRGIYCMSEAIDRSQLKLKKTADDGTVHGCLWKSKGFQYTCFESYGDYDNQSETWGDWEAKYPDIDDGPTDWSTLYNAVKWVADIDFSDYSAFYEHMDEYLDMPVYKDYFLFTQVLHALDNMAGKNMYWACYDKQKDKKITPFPWDLDCTVGQYPNDINHGNEPETSPERYYNLSMGEKIGYFLYEVYDDEEGIRRPFDWSYLDQMNRRYVEFRKGIFSEDSLISRYDRYMDMLTESGAYERDSLRWSGDTDIAGQTLDYGKEREYIHDWIHRRLLSLDKQFADPYAAYQEYTGIEEPVMENKTHTTHIYNISGMRVSNNLSRMPSGIYIIDGRKVVIN